MVGNVIGAATLGNSVQVPKKKVKTELQYDPAIPLFLSEGNEITTLKEICTPVLVIYTSIIYNSQGRETTRHEQMNGKENVKHTKK